MDGASQPQTFEPKSGLVKLSGALAGLVLMAALMAACNGGNGGQSPTAGPTGEGSTTPQPTGQTATNAVCQALASLDKYRYLSDVTLASPVDTTPVEELPSPVPTLTRAFTGDFHFEYNIDASVVAPDRVEAEMKLVGKDDPSNTDDDADTVADEDDNCPFSSNPGQEDTDGDGTGDACEGVNVIVVGDSRWVTVGDQWQEVGPEYIIPYQPMTVCTAIFTQVNLGEVEGKKESVNDVSAMHYTFTDTPSGQAMAIIFGPGSDMDLLLPAMNVEVWVAEKDDWPMRMDIQGKGWYGDGRELRVHVRVELRDINHDDIRVEPPM